MNLLHQSLNTFVGGEVTPKLLGRADIERFALSAETLENFMVRPQGPLTRRRGSALLATGVSPSGILASYAPRRDTSEVLLFEQGVIKVVTRPIPDYEIPATPPVVEYDDDPVRSGAKYGFLGQDGVTYYHKAEITGGWTGSTPESTYSGSIVFSRGLFLPTPDQRFDVIVVDDPNPANEDPDYPAPSGLADFTDLYQLDLAGAIVSTQGAVQSFTSQTTFDLSSIDASISVTLSEEYTDARWFEDVFSQVVASPNTWTGLGSSVTETLGTLDIRRSRFRFELPVAEMEAGGIYRVDYTLRYTPPVGPVVDTPASLAFTWDGVATHTTPFYLPTTEDRGTLTIESPAWGT